MDREITLVEAKRKYGLTYDGFKLVIKHSINLNIKIEVV